DRLNTIVSPAAAAPRAARSEPAPLSAVLTTVSVLGTQRSSSACNRSLVEEAEGFRAGAFRQPNRDGGSDRALTGPRVGELETGRRRSRPLRAGRPGVSEMPSTTAAKSHQVLAKKRHFSKVSAGGRFSRGHKMNS